MSTIEKLSKEHQGNIYFKDLVCRHEAKVREHRGENPCVSGGNVLLEAKRRKIVLANGGLSDDNGSFEIGTDPSTKHRPCRLPGRRSRRPPL